MALKTPDITPAQIIAVASAVIGAAVAFGLDLTKAQQDSLMTLVTVLASALVVGDAGIRNGRARIAAAAAARGEQP